MLKNTLTSFLIASSGLMAEIHGGLTSLCIGGLIAAMVSVAVNLNRSLSLLDMRVFNCSSFLFRRCLLPPSCMQRC
jgi:hypothetical protein